MLYSERTSITKRIRRNYDLYLLFFPSLAYFIIFKYVPIYGILLAFKNFKPPLGIIGSDWVGLKHFVRFFSSYDFTRLLGNTLGISILQIVIGFPVPILLALIINEIGNKKYKKILQTVTYAPHFISVVVLVGILMIFLSPRTGIINHIVVALGGTDTNYMGEAGWFKPIYVFTDIWQHAGYRAVIYIAALSAVDVELYDAAYIDGCGRFRKMIHIDIPSIMPMVIILLIMQCGRIMNIGFEKVLLMQNSLNISSSDIIQTYVYKHGLEGGEFSYATAVELFNNVINLILILTVNKLGKVLTNNSLW